MNSARDGVGRGSKRRNGFVGSSASERESCMKNFNAAEEHAVKIQREYYARTADRYDDMHVSGEGEHDFAAQYMIAAAKHLRVKSILDLGCGTGRGVLHVKKNLEGIRVVGVEPSAELREIGYSKGLSESEIVDGDAMNLAFSDGSFDMVCEFGALHHIPVPSKAVSEMLRVSSKAIFISDNNNFGQGGRLSRFMKQAFNAVRLWPLAYRIRTRGKGFSVSEGDGLAYSYSVFNNYRQIKEACASVHMLNTLNSGPDLYRTAPTLAILGIKHPTIHQS